MTDVKIGRWTEGKTELWTGRKRKVYPQRFERGRETELDGEEKSRRQQRKRQKWGYLERQVKIRVAGNIGRDGGVDRVRDSLGKTNRRARTV